MTSRPLHLVFLWGLAGLMAFPRPAAAQKHGQRVFLIGLDAGTWTVLDPMLRQGKLPHLRRLIQEGSSGILESFPPLFSPSLWTTIATGKGPDEHGITDFGVGEDRFTSGDREVQAIWNILSRHGRTVFLCGYLVTWPAEAVKGIVVSDRINDGPADKRLYPADGSLSELLESGLSWESPGVAEKTRRILPSSAPSDLERIFNGIAHDEQYAGIAERLLKRHHPDFFAIHLWGVDLVQHGFWKYLHTEDPRSQVIPRYYEYADELIGRLLSHADRDTVVLVVSDHGAQAGEESEGSSGEHAIEGILIAYGPGVRKGGKLPKASILDITPTMLYFEGLAIAEDMPGKVIQPLVDPKFLKAYPIRKVPTYEMPGQAKPREKIPAPYGEAEEKLLRSLGYLK